MEKSRQILCTRQTTYLMPRRRKQILTAKPFADVCTLNSKEKSTEECDNTNVPSRSISQSADLVWCLNIEDSAVDRWRRIGISQGLHGDTEIAVFLMAHYEQSLSRQPRGTLCSKCGTSLSQTCEFSRARPLPNATNFDTVDSAASTYYGKQNLQAKTVGTEALWMVKEEDLSPATNFDTADSARSMYYGKQHLQVKEEEDSSSACTIEDEPDTTKSMAEDNSPHTRPVPYATNFDKAASAGSTYGGKQNFQDKTVGAGGLSMVKEEDLSPACMIAGEPNATHPTAEDDIHIYPPGSPSEMQDESDIPKSGRRKCVHTKGSGVKSLMLKRYKCMHLGCGSVFTKSSRLKAHSRIHTGEKPYICNVCTHAFTQKSGLTVHMLKHTDKRPFSCANCPATFPSASTLKQHQRRHTGHLTQHMRMHEGIKPFLCPDCGKSFSASGDMNKHRVTHTNARPYKCDKCDKAYAFQHRLTAHKRSHTGDRPFLCTVCGSAFARSHNLTVHMRTHTGDKPYKCQDCGAKFSDSGNFSKHKKTKHGASEQSRGMVPKKKSIAADFGHALALHQRLPGEACGNFSEPESVNLAGQGLLATNAKRDLGADVSVWTTASYQVLPSPDASASEMLQRAAGVVERTDSGSLPEMVMLVRKIANVIAVNEMSNLLSSSE